VIDEINGKFDLSLSLPPPPSASARSAPFKTRRSTSSVWTFLLAMESSSAGDRRQALEALDLAMKQLHSAVEGCVLL
jgi:hypothetical protein